MVRRLKADVLTASMEPWPPSHGYVGVAQVEVVVLVGASMEPWPPSHGYCVAAPARTFAASSFNGAMASQPWIQDQQSEVPYVLPSFNGAMASQPWIRFRTIAAIKWKSGCFNGAMASQPWIH